MPDKDTKDGQRSTGRPRELENPERIELRMPAALLERIDAARVETGATRSGWIRALIERTLDAALAKEGE